MSNYSKKISELVSTGKAPESAVIPVALAGQVNETYRVSLNDIRANLLFENAYSSIANGISNTVKDEIFYVYTDDSQLYAAAFTNVNGASATAVYKDGYPVVYGTGKLMASGSFGSYTSYVSYLYNDGFAIGGETEIALPFECFDVVEMFLSGSHQVKNFNYTFDPVTNKVKLAAPLVANATLVLYVRPYPGTPVTPIQPGVTDYVNVAWLYNNGSAVGGETSLTPPWTFKSVPAIYLNGSKQVINVHYEIDSSGTKINLAKPLSVTDIVEVILGGSRSIITAQVSGTPAEVLVTLGLTTGATKINTSYGISLEQVAQGFYGVNSFSDLRNRRPNFEGEKVNLKGYYATGTSGSGEFVGHIGTATDDGGIIAAGNGFYWQRVISNVDINVEMFGAYPDTDTDSSVAFNLAWSSSYEKINVPSNRSYFINGTIGSLTVENKTKWIGGNNSVIRFGTNGNFNVTGRNWGFDSLTFVAVGVVPYALRTGLINNNRNSFIKNIRVIGDKSGSRFSVALDIYALWYSTITNVYINGSGEDDYSKIVYGGIGIQLHYCVNNTINNSWIGSCNTGIILTNELHPTSNYSCEGIIISDSTLIANVSNLIVKEGYYIQVIGNVIDIPLATTVNPVYFAAMASRFESNWVSVSTGTMYFGKGESGASKYDGSCNTIDGNVIRGTSGGSNDLITTGPIGLLVFTNNQMTFGNYAIVGGGGSNWFINGNTFSAQKTGTYDLHLCNNVRIGPNKVYSTGTPVKVVLDNAIISQVTFSSTTNITLAADALTSGNVVTTGQKFTVPVPSGYFIAAPEVAVATLATGSYMGICRYVKGESSATSLVFSFVGVGSAVTAGSCAFSIFASDRPSSF